MPLVSAARNGDIALEIQPADATDSSELEEIRGLRGSTFGIAFETAAFLAQLRSVENRIEADSRWRLVFEEIESDYGAGITEMDTNWFTADQLAELRARRILLDEHFTPPQGVDSLNQQLIEVFLRGQQTPLQVHRSPFPDLHHNLPSEAVFLQVARLVSILWLRLSGAVDIVRKLDMSLSGPKELKVDFIGVRRRRYLNEEPATISVRGTCKLTVGADTHGD